MSLSRRRKMLPWWFALPGLLWLIVFFAVPILNQVSVSLMSGDPEKGYELTWSFATYWDAIRDYHAQFTRSFGYAGAATLIDFVIAFPLAYFIAYKAGRFKGLWLLLVILPFFVSQVMRTASWQLILNDQGWLVARMQDVGIVADDGRFLATGKAVIFGISYNFLPFMVLPIYATLDRIDRRLIEAASDLYCSRWTAFRKVTLPLAVPGIFAGSLLVFIPACGDYINSSILGSSNTTMIGNVIQSKFLNILDYPTAAALSFILMGVILLGIAIYGRVLGTKNLTELAG
ncbi:ABC transporter permease [Patulibacter sp.]|uniref:ABC transporter permease n=1 Tax=Patulibacter sp. TaxID=1912859 RepID=UPI0027267AA8|nr:ABC transporter permease [Patulibacter sp.]MDO9410632.1 ABC transporter permease [Patulibacter sp.]